VLSTDHIHAHAYSRVGHKGLIFDRLDAGVGVGVADRGEDGSFTPGQFVGHASTGFDVPRIVPYARGLYHNRNRVSTPELGRFAQADPNASGMGLLDMPVYHGRAFSAGTISFDVQARYGDGGSLYGYMGGNPWMNSDSMGLFFGAAMSGWDGEGGGYNDPFDIVDEYIAEDAGSKAAFLENIYGAYDSGLYIAGQIAQLHPVIAIGTTVYNLASGRGSIGDILSMLPTSRVAKILATANRARTAAHVSYAASQPGAKASKNFIDKARSRAGGGNWSVYIVFNLQGRPVYVGITTQPINVRFTQHKREVGRYPWKSEWASSSKIIGGLSNMQARAIEITIIISNPQFHNWRRSIGTSNSSYGDWMDWANVFMRDNGIRQFY